MFTELAGSARELRNPLVLGYGIIFSLWICLGEMTEDALRTSDLGKRLLLGFDQLGSVSELALITFAAAMIGSLVWRLGIERLIGFIQYKLRHPSWSGLVKAAKGEVQSYEEYTVVTIENPELERSHKVPSPQHGASLMRDVESLERREADVAFRMTLAITWIPVSLSLGVVGSGWWWASMVGVGAAWLDVALMKETTASEILEYELDKELDEMQKAAALYLDFNPNAEAQHERLKNKLEGHVSRVQELHDERSRLTSRAFAIIIGKRRPEREVKELLDSARSALSKVAPAARDDS